MSFVVASPGLGSTQLSKQGGRKKIARSNLALLDRCFESSERRMRESNAAVWRLTPTVARKIQSKEISLADLGRQTQCDLAWLSAPYRWKDFSVLAMDMDSTVITIECIDEIADFAGKKEEVSAITEAAMRGEIKDYAESLKRRVALLKGLPEGVLQEVIRYRLKFTPGVKDLVTKASSCGLHTLLVSGGFVQFTDFVSQKIGFAQTRSNRLEIIDGRLTGRVLGDIVDADIKAKALQAACEALGVSAHRAIAVGDGANDLKMMGLSGLSIAHRAKPTVAAQAMQAVNFGGLDNVLDWFE